MDKRRRYLRAVSLILFVILLLTGVYASKQNNEVINIDGTQIPLGGGYVEQQDEDIKIIPDKYNTGCDKSKLETQITEAVTINGVGIGGYGTNTLAIRFKDTFENEIEFNNVDFSAMNFVMANDNLKTTECKVVFNNCKFGSLRTTNIYDSQVKYIYNNCSFTHFAGSNSEFYNCYFGDGSDGDGINPYRNCRFEDCMIANLIHSSENASGTNHVDGIQMFGDSVTNYDNTNIHFNNCRLEVPNIPYTYAKGILNCPITFTMRYSKASDISFENIYVNGGVYYSIMVYEGDYQLEDISFRNIKVGGARKSDNLIGDNPLQASVENLESTDSLYVSSVWKADNKIHLSVTNDTNQNRKMLIYTSNGVKEVDIKSCPVSSEIEKDSMNYEDFPFDMDITVDDAEWVVCYDITDDKYKQIRYENWGNERVLAPSFEIVEEDENASNVISGSCGKNAEFTFDEGVLTIEGSGDIYNFNSSKPAPWTEYKGDITEVVIEEGITSIGSQSFSKCENLENIDIADSVTTIGSNVFIKAVNLEEIELSENIQEIGRYAFFCSGVQNVKYTGTEEQWAQIRFGEYNTNIVDADVIYIDPDSHGEILSSGECGNNANWNLYEDGFLEVYGNGETYNYNSTKVAPWMSYAEEITSVNVEEGITVVGTRAFGGLTNLNTVYISDTVTLISGNAFIKCNNLSEVHFGSGIEQINSYAFGSTGVKTVYYNGDADMWSRIQIADNNTAIISAEKIYENGK